MIAFDGMVLAGGAGTRLGGVDKAGIILGGSTLLDRALTAVRAAHRVVLVGPERAGVRADVLQTREDPPRSGPAAAIDAGLSTLRSGGDHAPYTVVVAADLPAAAPAVRALLEAVQPSRGRAVDGWVATDPDARSQFLLAAYRTAALTEAVRSVAATRGTLVGAAVRELLAPLRLEKVPLPAHLSADIDTAGDLAVARARERTVHAPSP